MLIQSNYKLVLSGTFDKPAIKLTVDSTEVRGATFTQEKDIVNISFERSRAEIQIIRIY